MALPATGPISLSQVNVELGLSATALITLNDAAVRNLAGVASGAISMQDLRGKANVFAFAIASNLTNANLRTLAVNAGWNGTAPVLATINSGVVISGNVQGNSTAALTVNGSFPGGVTLINSGTISGQGGNGGNGGAGGGDANAPTVGVGGSTGGRAVIVSVPLTLQNNGTIAGGGGGGGGGGGSRNAFEQSDSFRTTGGRGGGGGGGRSSSSNSAGGVGGDLLPTQRGTSTINTFAGTGGTGTFTAPGGGGAGGERSRNGEGARGGAGGAGGNRGAGGGTGATGLNLGFFYSGFGAINRAGGAGGAAGQAISGNSNITYTATGTRLGPIA